MGSGNHRKGRSRKQGTKAPRQQVPGEEGSHLGQEILKLGLNIATLESRENACSIMLTDLLPYPPPAPSNAGHPGQGHGVWRHPRESSPPGLGRLGKNLLSFSEPRFWMGRTGHRWVGSCADRQRGSPGVHSEVLMRLQHGGRNLTCSLLGAQDCWKSSQPVPSPGLNGQRRWREEDGERGPNRRVQEEGSSVVGGDRDVLKERGQDGELEGVRGQGFLGGSQHGPKQVGRAGNWCSEARREGREKDNCSQPQRPSLPPAYLLASSVISEHGWAHRGTAHGPDRPGL